MTTNKGEKILAIKTRLQKLACVLGLVITANTGFLYAQGAITQKEFVIQSQPMETALNSLAQQANIQLVVFSEDLAGINANLLEGNFTIEQALVNILNKTNLEYLFINDTTVAVGTKSRILEYKNKSDDNGVNPIDKAENESNLDKNSNAEPAKEENTNEDDSNDNENTLLVTGSRISGAADSGAIAVTSLTAEELAVFGESSTGDILSNLPQAGNFEINESADGVNDARGDIATVNLRGLGSGNTLILLNGRRITAHGINQDVGSVPRSVTNVNAFPSSAIKRVEVLRDGASALYGSDATAGVVNTILTTDLKKDRFSYRQDFLEGTDSEEKLVDFATSFEANEGKTTAIIVASLFKRSGLYASELGEQFSRVDKRNFLQGFDSPWADSSDFRNTSSDSPFGSFEVVSEYDPITGLFEDENIDLDRDYASDNGISDRDLTRGGRFHIQPCGFDDDSRVQIGTSNDGCMAIGEDRLPTELRFDFNNFQTQDSLGNGFALSFLDPRLTKGRQLISDAKRQNFYSLIEHQFDSGIEGFADLLFYRSSTESQRAPSPITLADGILVPKTNYYNPFGAIGTDNRLVGLEDGDVPDEGYDILIRNWRPIEGGPRIIETRSTTYRVLTGLRGDYKDWDWETSVGYSENETRDSENRFSKTLLNQALALSTENAINPFLPNGNTPEQIRAVQVERKTVGSTSLATLDFRISKPDVFSNWAGDIGVAAGFDYRNEAYEDDQDSRVDGTIRFNNVGSGISDIVSQSPTQDSEASRNVYALYFESLLPLIEKSSSTWSNELNLQVAGRFEYFDDIEENVFTPKIALSYFPVSGLSFRAAYSEGFRAPNLVQLNRAAISRTNDGNIDFVRSEAIGNPEDVGDTNMRSIRLSNSELRPEDTETSIVGMSIDFNQWLDSDWVDSLRFYADLWEFEQTDMIDNFGVQESLALDFLRRLEGSSNPNVVRAEVTSEDIDAFNDYNLANPQNQVPIAGQVLEVLDPFINLDRQTARGLDIGLSAKFDLDSMGSLKFRADFSSLKKLDIYRNEELVALAEDPRFGNEFDALTINRLEVNGHPKRRSSVSLIWRKDQWKVGTSMRYVSGFNDTSADNVDIDGDGEDDLFRVDSHKRVNLYVDYRLPFSFGDKFETRLRLGVNNISDELPPIVDSSRGYSSQVHSIRGREYYIKLRSDF